MTTCTRYVILLYSLAMPIPALCDNEDAISQTGYRHIEYDPAFVRPENIQYFYINVPHQEALRLALLISCGRFTDNAVMLSDAALSLTSFNSTAENNPLDALALFDESALIALTTKDTNTLLRLISIFQAEPYRTKSPTRAEMYISDLKSASDHGVGILHTKSKP